MGVCHVMKITAAESYPDKGLLNAMNILLSSSSSLPVTPAGVLGSNKAPPSLSVTGQPLDGDPAVVLVNILR